LHPLGGRHNVAQVGRRVICISRSDGAHGDDVGRLVAERLGCRYVDEEIVAQAAARGGISPAEVADEERRRSALGRLMRELGRGGRSPTGARLGISGLAHEPGSTSDEIRDLIQASLEETAAGGDVVIVAHAASFALSGSENVLRVLVTASPDVRTRALAESNHIDPETARKAIEAADAARASYLRRFHGVDSEQATHYDLVLNTGSLGTELAADLVVLAAG